jgi:hypothetical protein
MLSWWFGHVPGTMYGRNPDHPLSIRRLGG